jgi:hypothetical protein
MTCMTFGESVGGRNTVLTSDSRAANLRLKRVQTFNSPAKFLSHNTLVLWTHNNSFLKSPTMSSSESLLSEEQMQGRPRFSKEFAIPPRVHISTDLIRGEGASGYVLILSGAFDFIVWSGSTRGYTRGWADLFLSLTADRDDPARSAGSITSSTKSSFQVMKAMFSTTLVDSKLAAKTS